MNIFSFWQAERARRYIGLALLLAFVYAGAALFVCASVGMWPRNYSMWPLPLGLALAISFCIAALAALEMGWRAASVPLAAGMVLFLVATITAWVFDLRAPFGVILYADPALAGFARHFPSLPAALAAILSVLPALAILLLGMRIALPTFRPLGWACGLVLATAPWLSLLIWAVRRQWPVPHAPHSAQVFAGIAVALFGYALLVSRHTRFPGSADRGARLRSTLVVLVVCSTLLLWQAVRATEMRQLQSAVQLAHDNVTNTIAESIADQSRAVARTVEHWRTLGWQVSEAVFAADSRALLRDYPSISGVWLTAADGTVRHALGDSAAIAWWSDRTTPIQQALRDNRTLSTAAGTTALTVLIVPVGDTQPLGAAIVAYRPELNLATVLDDAASGFDIDVRLRGVVLYQRTDSAAAMLQRYRIARTPVLQDTSYDIEVVPSREVVTQNLSAMPSVVLLFAWVSLLLLVFALHNERRAQTLLQERERILNQSLDIICTVEGDGRIATMNEASRRMLGYAPAELQQRSLLGLVVPEEREQAIHYWLDQETAAATHTPATRFMRRDGSTVYLQGLSRWSAAERLHYLTVRDITTQHELELAKQHAANTLRIGVEQAGCVVYEYLPAADRIEWIGAVEVLTGYLPGELVAGNFGSWMAAVHPDDREHTRVTLQRCVQGAQGHTLDYRLRRKNGDYVPVLDRGRFVDAGDAAPRMIGALIDLSTIRRQEQALRRSEERYRIIATQVGAVILERDLASGRVHAYGPVEQIFGFGKQQLETRLLSAQDLMVHPEDRTKLAAAMAEAELALSSYYVEYRRRHQGRHYIHIAARGVVLAGPDGRAERMVIAITDITDRKHAEQLLQQSEERFRLAIEQAKQIVYEYGLDNELRIESRRFAGAVEAMLGYTLDEMHTLYANGNFVLVHPDDLPQVRALGRTAIRSDGTFQLEHRMRHKAGHYVTVDSRGAVRRNARGEVVWVLGMLLDISARRAAEADAERYTARLYRLAEVARKVSTLLAPHELAEYLTRAMRELLAAGAAAVTITGTAPAAVPIVVAIHGDSLQRRGFADELHTLLTGREPVRLSCQQLAERAPELSQPQRQPYPLRGWLAVALTDRDGGSLGVLEATDSAGEDFSDNDAQILSQLAGLASVAVENIRLYATLEERVTARTRELQLSNRELEAFSYSVSHDLRAPLRAIAGFSSMLQHEFGPQLGDGGRRYLQRITGGVERMASLIDDLLSLARVSRVEVKRESIDLSALCRTAVKRQLERHPERKLQIKIEPRLHAQADPRLVEVALDNLLDNAIKFTATRALARIHVGQRSSAGQPAFFVRDNGVGFDPQYAANLFGVFQRLHSASEFPGTGVGLATVQRIVQRHRGRVWAESQLDQGATFYFTFDSE
jgi:PAS domain S-box-containing protein